MKALVFVLSFFIITQSMAQDPVGMSTATAPSANLGDELFSPKVKAFLVVSGYGAAGGGLLGLASMAFGEDGKAIARGAALGLYAGILFGAYILYTHEQMQNQYQALPPEDYNPRDYSAGFRRDINKIDLAEDNYFDNYQAQQTMSAWQVPVASFTF